MDPNFDRALQRIPPQLRDPSFRFVVILRGNKKPEGKRWSTDANYPYGHPVLAGYLAEGHNYGTLSGTGGLVVLDVDDPARLEALGIIDKLPETFTVRTGRGGLHFYLLCPELKDKIILEDPELKDTDGDPLHLGELQALGQQVVGPGSIHPNGNRYEIVKDVPIAAITKGDLLQILAPLEQTVETEAEHAQKARTRKSGGSSLGDLIPIDQVAWPKDIKERAGSEVRGSHPLHGSKSGKNFAVNTSKNCWHCFRHKSGGGPLEWLAVEAGLISCQDAGPGCLDKDAFKKTLQIARERGFDIPEPQRQKAGERDLGVLPDENRSEFEAAGDHEPATDGGNAQRLIRLHKNNIRYCHTFKKWLLWDGHRWKVDSDGSAYCLCADVIREIYATASKCIDSRERQEWAKFAIRSDSGRGYKDMLFLASFNKAVAITADMLDTDPWLLNAENLTIDLKTLKVREPRREDLITKTLGTRYDETAKCSLWLKFLQKIFGGDQELINYVQRAVGYSLTGSMIEQTYFFCHGTGANGKSVFLATLRALLGEYARQASFDTFLIQRAPRVRNDLAALAGARVITASEAEEGSRLSMQVIKSWTGGDPITARFLFGEDFTFRPVGKIWLAANTRPIISERNYAAWRRVHLIPFGVTIPPEEQDRELESKLLEELPGILNWALEGLKEYHRIGLHAPEAVRAATDAYRRENDSLAAFLSECCEVRKLAVCKNSDLFGAYLDFCRMDGYTPVSQMKFSGELSGVEGVHKTRDGQFGVIWHGIQLSKNWSATVKANQHRVQAVKTVKPNPQSFENFPHEGNFAEMPSQPSRSAPDSDSENARSSRIEEQHPAIGPHPRKTEPTPHTCDPDEQSLMDVVLEFMQDGGKASRERFLKEFPEAAVAVGGRQFCAVCGEDLTGKSQISRGDKVYCAKPGCGYPPRRGGEEAEA